METTNVDFFFVIMFMVVVSVIIGLNIVSVVDKKIGNVSIKIPPIQVPRPQIVIKMSSNNDNPEIQVCSDGSCEKIQIEKQKPKIPVVQKATITKATKAATTTTQIEGFASVAQENGKTIDYEDEQVDDHFEEKEQIVVEQKTNQDAISSEGQFHRPRHQVQFGTGPIDDPAEFYKNNQVWKMLLHDPIMRGSNYSEYSNFVTPNQIENKITKEKQKGHEPGAQGKNIPIGHNFAFNDSPAQKTI